MKVLLTIFLQMVCINPTLHLFHDTPYTAQMIWNLSKYQEMHFKGITRFPFPPRRAFHIQTFAEEQTKSASSAMSPWQTARLEPFNNDAFWSNVTWAGMPPSPAGRGCGMCSSPWSDSSRACL